MKIGIICAVEKEIHVIREVLSEWNVFKKGGTEIYICQMNNLDIAFTLCGVGKVSASVAAQSMIDNFRPDYIINSGAAGALSSNLEVGDIVLSTKCAQHDISVVELGHPIGYIHSLDTVEIHADEKLRELIRHEIPKDIHVEEGLIVSGDQFIAGEVKRQNVLKHFPDALVAEMEGAAVAQVCAQNNIPFCILRCVSDNANGDSNVDYVKFAPKAGERSAKIIIQFLKNYSNNLNK